MIRRSGNRFADKIMRQINSAGLRPLHGGGAKSGNADGARRNPAANVGLARIEGQFEK